MFEVNKKCQSTLEYILIITAIVGVLLFMAGKYMRPAVGNYLDNSGGAVNSAVDRLP